MRRSLTGLVVLGALLTAGPAMANLRKPDRKAAKKMLAGTLYMRIDAPCATGRHMYGTYKRPLVEVSPEGVNTEGELAMNFGWWHADSTYWGIGVNDPVEVDEIDFDDDGIEIELQGVGAAEDNATVLKFVDVDSLQDFEAAMERTFARVPLQDEHDDWPQEIKDAIADGRLLDGMTKRQAFCVTGTPESFRRSEEDGVTVEVWNLRQNKGMKMGFWRAKGGETTGLPPSIRFVDGKLTDLASVGTGETLSLDD